MHIAIDSGPLSSGHAVRGVGFYTSELIDHLSKQRIGLEKVVVDEFDFSKEQKYLSSDRYDIIHFTNFNLFELSIPISLKTRAKKVITIHDVIPLIYPKVYLSGFRGKINLAVQKQVLKSFDAIITVSETSKKDIVRLLNIPNPKVHVAYEAHRQIFSEKVSQKDCSTVAKKYKLPKKFVLYVGDVNYNKNIDVLVDACKKADIPLVVVGKKAGSLQDYNLVIPALDGPRDWIRFVFDIPHPEVKHFQDLYQKFVVNHVITTGFVPDTDLSAIFRLASVYVQPSLYEGFGLPVLEAMSTGLPTIVSRTQCLTELFSDSSLIASTNDPDDFAKKIKKVVMNKKIHDELAKSGLELVKRFSWDKHAKEVVKIYKSLLA